MAGFPRDHKYKWLDELMAVKGLAAGSKIVGYAIASFWNKGVAWPSHRKLAERCGMSEIGVRRAAETLRDAGFVDWSTPKGGSNRYHLKRPGEAKSGTNGDAPPIPEYQGSTYLDPRYGSITPPDTMVSPNTLSESFKKVAIVAGSGSTALKAETEDRSRFYVVRLAILMLGLPEDAKIGSVTAQDWVASALGASLDDLAARHQGGDIESSHIADALKRGGVKRALNAVASRVKAA